MQRFNWRMGLGAILAAALVACGGSDHPGEGQARITVVGDSLSDSGTFEDGPGSARSFTIQGTADEPYVLWVERLAKAYALDPLCPAYHYDGAAFQPEDAGCSNYAVGGGRINNALQAGGQQAPLAIPRQLADASAGGWDARDLIVIDGGGNDMADLVTAYLGRAQDAGAAYQELLLTLLPPETLAELLPQENGPETAAVAYLQQLADALADSIEATTVGRGATRVLVANMPTVTFTPKFQLVLGTVEQQAGPEARVQLEGLFRQWINSYNAELTQRFAKEPRVRVVDVAQGFNDFMADPAQFGLTNVQVPACGGPGFDQLPARDFAQCTAAALEATVPPPGATGRDWWQRFLFADSFHPTPYGHQLMAEQALEVLSDAGWR